MMLIGLVFGVGVLSWWLTRRLSRRDSFLFLLDHPNERSLHDIPIPRTGGVAIVGSLFLGLIAARALGFLEMSEGLSWFRWVYLENWILGMTILLGLVSFMDDRGRVPVWFRLGCQFSASAILALGAGLVLPAIEIPLLGTIELRWLGGPLTILLFIWVTNLYNFMDGMDGFAGGMTVIGCGLLGYLGWQAHHPVISFIATLQAAAAAGFLVHNFPPAKIFMGDVGSVSTGFLAAALIVLGCRDGVFDLWVPLIVFSPFIVDATVTLVRRALHHEKVWQAHRDHYYQRLVLSGWGHRRTVLAEYGVMALCGGLALFYQYASEEWRLVVLGAWGMVFLSLAFAVRGVEQRIQPVGS
ncbi:MAG TPA: glycosyltransferase family 4 protein [Nitrospiraceae bacterium]|nr:glycosyltransferase family 4 protein [Nitrospiraceae bacterium]